MGKKVIFQRSKMALTRVNELHIKCKIIVLNKFLQIGGRVAVYHFTWRKRIVSGARPAMPMTREPSPLSVQ